MSTFVTCRDMCRAVIPSSLSNILCSACYNLSSHTNRFRRHLTPSYNKTTTFVRLDSTLTSIHFRFLYFDVCISSVGVSGENWAVNIMILAYFSCFPNYNYAFDLNSQDIELCKKSRNVFFFRWITKDVCVNSSFLFIQYIYTTIDIWIAKAPIKTTLFGLWYFITWLKQCNFL